ncbi:MAG: flagellar assembly protein FliW [Bdellovibrionota bacterium]
MCENVKNECESSVAYNAENSVESDAESNTENSKEEIIIKSLRFGDLKVPKESLIYFPSGLIGFPKNTEFVMLEHKAPFSWLHSADDPALAFVVIDGYEFGVEYSLKPPLNDPLCDFREDDEYAILIIVTVRKELSSTTANLKAPLFVNLRNRKGVQVIFDDPKYSTRHPLWVKEEEVKEGEKENPSDETQR